MEKWTAILKVNLLYGKINKCEKSYKDVANKFTQKCIQGRGNIPLQLPHIIHHSFGIRKNGYILMRMVV